MLLFSCRRSNQVHIFVGKRNSATVSGGRFSSYKKRTKTCRQAFVRAVPCLRRLPGALGGLEACLDYGHEIRQISRTVEDYEASANVAYELTFLLAGILSFVYVVLIKKDRLVPKMEAPKYVGAVCETAGQFAYIYAIADTEHLAMSAPIIASYCAASVLWSRIFLKEKLSWKHYAMIILIVAGIAIMGVFDL